MLCFLFVSYCVVSVCVCVDVVLCFECCCTVSCLCCFHCLALCVFRQFVFVLLFSFFHCVVFVGLFSICVSLLCLFVLCVSLFRLFVFVHCCFVLFCSAQVDRLLTNLHLSSFHEANMLG